MVNNMGLRSLSLGCLGLALLVAACSPENTPKPTKPQDTTASSNGYGADFEQHYVAQCLKEQTSVNVDTKVYCICMGSYVVRETKAGDFMPVWQAHVADNDSAEQKAQLEQWAADAKKRRGCRIEKF